MGEEKKGAEEVKKEGKGEEKDKAGEEKGEDKEEEVVMRVYMHCEGCARKVKNILRRFDGVGDVSADLKTNEVVAMGKKVAANPMKVVEHVQKKTRHKVELLSPIPLAKEENKDDEKEEPEPPKLEEEEEPKVISVVLKVHMHCEACAQIIRKRILKMKGVQSAEPDLKESQVTVKGIFEEGKLAKYVHKRIGKHAAIVKSESTSSPENVGDDQNGKDKETTEGCGEKEEKDGSNTGGEEKEEKEKDGGNASGGDEKDKERDLDAINLYFHCPTLGFPYGYFSPGPNYAHPSYPPQIFSDENPNACFVM